EGRQPPAAPSGWRKRFKGLLWLFQGDDADLATSGASKFTALGRRPEGEDEAPPRGAPPGVQFFWGLSALLVCFFAWMAVGTLDIVSMTMGEVIPSSQVKTIQHLEGGIVLEIPVREGQAVTKGQPLVVLEQTFSGADVAELRVRLNSLTVDIKRLEAEAAERPELSFDAETQEQFPELVMQAIERFDARRNSRENKILSQQQSIQQRKDEINESEV
ncbi:MAG: hypothetical protein HQL35_15285, partial [Alphaproteobacteria bacterium]|nr:hypothetical protein [Alphaproteobacteria bacterium]